MSLALDPVEYRKTVSAIFEKIASAFDTVDPDVAEAEVSQGALTIQMPKSKIIVSAQPPVQQIWLAAAALGVAIHFSWDVASGRWMDDKNRGLEFFAYLTDVVEKSSGLRVPLG